MEQPHAAEPGLSASFPGRWAVSCRLFSLEGLHFALTVRSPGSGLPIFGSPRICCLSRIGTIHKRGAHQNQRPAGTQIAVLLGEGKEKAWKSWCCRMNPCLPDILGCSI